MKTLVIDLKSQLIFLPEDVERIKSSIDIDYHIYAILLSHKYYIKDGMYEQKKEGIFFPVFSPTNGFSFTLPFYVNKGLDHTKLKIDIPFPYEKFFVTIEDDEWKSKNPDKEFYLNYNVTKIVDKILFQECIDRDYKIVYIGQAFGMNGERIAVDRLISHSTLQKILSDCQSIYSEYNVRILLMDFQQDYQLDYISSGGFTTIIPSAPKMPENQIINLTEAALINYFKPEYNKDFKSNFPSNKHTSYHELFDSEYTELALDLSYLYESDVFPSLDLYTDHNRISCKKNSIHYKIQKGGSILSFLPFDDDVQ